MRCALAVLASLLLASSARADEPADESAKWGGHWSKTDTATEIVVMATLAIDYSQTKRILADGREGNSLLASGHISADAYFLTFAATHVVAMRVLPPRWRHLAQGLTIGAESSSIIRNCRLGYAVEF